MNQAIQILREQQKAFNAEIDEAVKKLNADAPAKGGQTININRYDAFVAGVGAGIGRTPQVSPKKAYWTPAKRRAQSKRIKAMWEAKRAEAQDKKGLELF